VSARIERADIVDYVTYEDTRAETRDAAMAAKAPRRIHVGTHLTFLFENRQTLIYQVQEIMRAERIVREAAIQGEIDAYNELLGGAGELGCVLLIEVEDADERARRLVEWFGMQHTLYARLADGTTVAPRVDPGQADAGKGKLSSVQYLHFLLPEPPIAIGCGFPALAAETVLDDAQRAALAADLAASHDH